MGDFIGLWSQITGLEWDKASSELVILYACSLLLATIALGLLVVRLVELTIWATQKLRRDRLPQMKAQPTALPQSQAPNSQSAPALQAAAAVATSAAKPPRPTAAGALTKGLTPGDREFLPAALELLETPPSPIAIAGLWLICIAFTSALVWSYFGKIDIHAVAQGRIQPSGRTKVIQPVEAGKIVAINVENGMRVKAGDILLELDPTETGADRAGQTRELESSRAEIARRRVAVEVATSSDPRLAPKPIPFDPAISDGVREREEQVLAGDLGQLRSSRANLAAQLDEKSAMANRLAASVAAREKVIALAKERVEMRSTLNDQGSLSRALVIEVLAQYETQMTTQVSEQGQLIETKAAIQTVKTKMDELVSQFVSDQTGKSAEAARKADRIAQDLIKATAKNERTTLRAPIAGTVQQLAVSTVGQVVGGAQSLMTIVPTDAPIEIEAMIQNGDIGFVESGQEAVIKVEAFPFSRYGSINGTVARVSRDAVEEHDALAMADPMTAARPQGASGGGAGQKGPNLVFPALIRLERNTIAVDGKNISLSPGMSVTVEILTGQRRAIDFVLSPLREIASTTARER